MYSDQLSDTPSILACPVQMTEANQIIPLYKGIFVVKTKDREYKVDGEINFSWLATKSADIEGLILEGPRHSFDDFFEDHASILIDDTAVGVAHVSIYGEGSSIIGGYFPRGLVLGERTVNVQKVMFCIPNLKWLDGKAVKIPKEGFTSFARSRINLDNKNYSIKIDRLEHHTGLYESLKAKGGYIITYAGELTKKQGDISIKESQAILHCFSVFISFINGRETSAYFRYGMFQEETIWRDHNTYSVEVYKYAKSWMPQRHNDTLGEMWIAFSELWSDKDGKNFITSAINWYLDANSGLNSIEGQIILAQTALELLYNKLVVEDKKIIIGKDAEIISAAGKIRLLLSQLAVPSQIPTTLTHLVNYASTINKRTVDGPEVFVEIRNAIVHSQEIQRKKLAELDLDTMYEVLQLSLWYVELSLLYIFNYKGQYWNRCLQKRWSGDGEEYVPWVTPPVPPASLLRIED